MSASTAMFYGGALLVLLGGCQGPPGKDGTSGADGTNGVDGVNGTNGADGVNGTNGADGVNGTNGADGVNGTNGVDGVNGTNGTNGYDGREAHQGDAPWGVNVTIVSVDGASGASGAFQAGDTPSITYEVLDNDGIEYGLDEISGLWFDMAGPVTDMQIAYYYGDVTDVLTSSVDNHDGSYTYTFSQPIPSTYHAVPNDTSDLGSDDGDLGGEAMVDGTYVIGADAYIRYTDAGTGESWYDAGDATTDVLYGTATALDSSAEISADNCAACHGDSGFRAHGGSRRSVALCRTCHVDGAEDRYSATDDTVTPKTTIAFKSMIHKIHAGSELANGAIFAGYPADSTAEGYPNYNLYDYSDVEFPQVGTGSGMLGSSGVSDCNACHAGATTAVDTAPSRLVCGSCHDSIDFTETDSSAADYHPGGTMTSDTVCNLCHTASAIDGYHDDPRSDSSVWKANGFSASGLNVTLLSAVNQDGDTTFAAGDTITVTFSVLADDGTPVPQSAIQYSASSSTCPTVSGAGTLILVGPSDHMQRVLYSQTAGKSTTKGSIYGSSTVDTTTGIWTYTFSNTDASSQTIPTTFPYQYNDAAGGYGTAYGDLGGQALTDGTYRLTLDLYTTLWDDTKCGSSATRYRWASSDSMNVLVGSTATTLEPHDVVADANCENCHGRVEMHGGTRAGTEYCEGCHTPGATDSSTAPTTRIDFANVIHSVHANQFLTNAWSVTGYSGTTSYDFKFPRQDGGVEACEACHAGSDAYLQPSALKCMTCHNGDDDLAHAAIMTDDTYGESCDVCHGPDGEFSVKSVHEFTH